MIAAGYGAAVDMLRSASRDTYRGPANPVPTLIDALRTTEGLRPDDLVTHTRTAAGPAASAWLGPLIQALLRLLAEVALGELLRRLVDRAQDWWDDRDAARDLEDSAEDAGNALKDIEDVADTALTEITDALTAVITQLCAFLSRIDPATHPGMFQECVGAGSELIDSAGDALLQTCTDRDEAVAGCLDEFLTRCEAVCEQPVAAPQDDVADCDDPPAAPVPAPEKPVMSGDPAPSDGPATTPQAAGGQAPPPPAAAVTPPAADAPTSPPTPAPEAPPLQQQPTTPQTAAPDPPEVDCPPNGLTPPAAEPPAPATQTATEVPTAPQTATPEPVEECEPAAANCAGVLGSAGMGVAVLGLVLLIGLLEEFAPEVTAPEPVPEAEPVVEPVADVAVEPAAEPVAEPALAEVPEPPPPPKQSAPDPTPPPVDLADVPEPTPPPKQQVPTPPAETPPPAPDNPPAPAPVPGGARKAGEW